MCLKHPFQDRKYNSVGILNKEHWKVSVIWLGFVQHKIHFGTCLSKSHLSVSILFKCSVVLDLNIECTLFQKCVCMYRYV